MKSRWEQLKQDTVFAIEELMREASAEDRVEGWFKEMTGFHRSYINRMDRGLKNPQHEYKRED